MPTPESIDDVFSALGKFVRIRSRSVQASAKSADGGAETAAKRALFVLRHGPIRAGELAAAMSADPSTMSRHVAQLVDDGLVRREPDPEDGRACRLVLTDDGFERVAVLAARRREAIGELVADWPDEDFATFAHLLTRFVDAVEAHSMNKDLRGDA
ncbi:MarR family winged helix-turn-helix transcriptional regulator [Gordonia humi]|uniref:DNA-binding MarR family transcriptional regulator n=1 Tax=Gordonia humi TaxID=686429 RepID=A0A840EVU4_9ACTN|nr:MarR family transcriptional regulator [Gordonia humi]MBB4134443.1 DNA-binding MarR family transcriptional regulator [Gordonia humi]